MLLVRLSAAIAVSLWLFSLGSVALGQAPGAVEQADRLFQQALVSIDAGRCEEAVPKLEESHRLAPASGTLLNLADCYARLGRTAQAYRTFVQTAELARSTAKPERERLARQGAEALLPKLAKLTVTPPSQPIPNLQIALDGQILPEAEWGTGTPVVIEPGTHRFGASAPGRRSFEYVLTEVTAGGTAAVEIPNLEVIPPAEPIPSLPTEKPSRGLDTQQIWAVVSAGIGVVGLGLGTAFALNSQAWNDESDRYCTGDLCSDPRGVDAMNDARAAGDRATVAMAVGAAGLGAAAVLWIARPFGPETPAGTEIGLGPGAVRLRARW